MGTLSVCLSRGSTRLHCAKTAELIKMLFMMNSLGGPWNTVLRAGTDSPQRGWGKLGKILPIMDPLHISETARDLKIFVHIEDWDRKNRAKEIENSSDFS